MQPKPQQVFCKIILGPYFVHISEFTAEYVSQGISQLVDIFPSLYQLAKIMNSHP